MCETLQSSHRLCPVMTLVRAFLAPTASGDGAGALLCTTAAFASLFFLSGGGLSQKALRSHGGVGGTSKIILDCIYKTFILSSVWSGESWTDLERLEEKW